MGDIYCDYVHPLIQYTDYGNKSTLSQVAYVQYVYEMWEVQLLFFNLFQRPEEVKVSSISK